MYNFPAVFLQHTSDDVVLMKKLDNINEALKIKDEVEKKLNEYESNITRLQILVSDLQSQLLQERDQLFKLHLENERLKNFEQEYWKVLQLLHHVCEPCKEKTIEVYPDCPDKLITLLVNSASGQKLSSKEFKLEILRLLDERDDLENRLKFEHKKNSEQVKQLLADQHISTQERLLERQRHKEHLDDLCQTLSDCHKLLFEATCEYLHLYDNCRQKELQQLQERENMQTKISELSKLLQDKNLLKQNEEIQKIKIKTLKEHLIETQKELKQQKLLCSSYCDKLKTSKKELYNVKIQNEKQSQEMQNRFSILQSNLESLQQQNKQLELRRKLENEGFSNDVNLLKQQLKKIENLLYSLSHCFLTENKMQSQVTVCKDVKNDIDIICETLQKMHYFLKELSTYRS